MNASLPRLISPYVHRPRLVEAIKLSSCHLISLLAPAGFGKTTLMLSCAEKAECKVAWISLNGQDITTDELCHRIRNALTREANAWSTHEIESTLANYPEKIWIMLDDFPRSTTGDLDAVFGRLISVHSPNIKWCVSSRRRLDLNFAKLMMQGELLQIEAEDLTFNSEEIDSLLSQLEVPATQKKIIVEECQGWVAAIKLLAIQSAAPKALLLEYVGYELLNDLKVSEREILFLLANFSSFNQDLFSYIFKDRGGEASLAELIRRGAFIVPSNSNPGNFQLLTPVAGLLAPLAPPQELKTINRLACQYYLQKGDLRSAIEHAVFAEQFEVAASLLERLNEDELLHDQAGAKILAYRNRLPTELIESTPRLVALYAFTYSIMSRPDDAMRCLDALGKFLPAPTQAEQRKLLGWWQGVRGVAAHTLGDSKNAQSACQEALEVLGTDSQILQFGCSAVLIQQLIFRGAFDSAESQIQKALVIAHKLGSAVAESFCCLSYSMLLESKGELAKALKIVEDHLANLNIKTTLRSRLIVRQAYINFRMGRLKVARQLFILGFKEGALNRDPVAFHGLIGQAFHALLNGETIHAEAFLDEAERWQRSNNVASLVYISIIQQARAAALIEKESFSKAEDLLREILSRHGEEDNLVVQPFERADFLLETRRLLARVQISCGKYDEAERNLQSTRTMAIDGALTLVNCDAGLLLAEIEFLRGNDLHARQYMTTSVKECERLQYHLPLEYIKRRQPGLMRLIAGETPNGLLSKREVEVLRLIETGLSNQEIANNLYISLFTVKSHIQRISTKLEVKRRTQAVAKAKSLGLI